MTVASVSEPIPALTPELFDGLRTRVEDTLLHLVKKNRHTRYVRDSPVFSDFRGALDALGDACDARRDEALLESFRTTMPMTGYDSYEPFINALVTPNANEKDVKDMFSPGLPCFIASSSGTSGKKAKLFAKYRHAVGSSVQDVDQHANPVSDNGGKNCIVYSLLYQEVVQVLDDDKAMVAQFPITSMSSGVIRMQNGMDVHKDPWTITLTAPRATSPIAVSHIANYKSYLLMHVLFALADPQLATINTLFGSVFVDMIRYMEEEWDALVDSIETGVLPDWEGTNHVRQYLEPKFSARPERAAHLRAVGKTPERPGWLKELWPALSVVIGIASGAFSVIVPKMQHYLGSDVHMTSLGFTASEAYIGTAWRDVSLFKATNDDIVEYLDVSQPETTSNLVFAHQVQTGRRYEIVVTARDGLWRYRLGDVVEIAGFDPIDGSPILRYIERRGAFIRLASALISEEVLTGAITSAGDALGRITEFTVVVDDRKVPSSLAFLVEMDGTLSPSADDAPAQIDAALRRSDENVLKLLNSGRLAPPSVHVVRPGTFREYRARKVAVSVTGPGQVKVPVVLSDAEVQAWILDRVERVIARPQGGGTAV